MPKFKLNLVGELPEGVSSAFISAVEKAFAPQTQLAEVNLKLVDEASIKELNEKYAGLSEVTDVLSFEYPDGEGDIAICLPVARAQAKQASVGLPDELATLLTHGLLHLSGLDHQTPAQQAKMDKVQSEIINRAGYKSRKFEWK